MIKHRSPISGIAASPDGTWIATAGYDNRVILSKALSKESVAQGSHDHLVNQCQFSPDGMTLVTSGSDHLARLWSIPDLKLIAVLGDHKDDVEMSVFNPMGSRIATACRDGGIRIFSTDGRLLKVLHGHESDVISLQWSLDGRELISSGDDGTVRTWSDNGELIKTISFDGVETDTIALDDTGLIFAGNDRGEILVLDGQATLQSMRVHNSGVKRLVFDSRTQLLISLSYDRSLKILKWIRSKGELQLHQSTTFPSVIWPRSAAIVNESTLALASFGSTYALFNWQRNEWDLSKIEPTSGINAVLPMKDGIYSVGDSGVVFRDSDRISDVSSLCNFLVSAAGLILTGGQNGAVINASSGEVLYQHHSPLNCGVAWNLNGFEFVAIGSYTGEALIFMLEDSTRLVFLETRTLHDNAIKSLAYDSGVLMSVSATGEAVFSCAESRKVLVRERFAHDKIANGCAAVPNLGFASVSRDLHLRIWSHQGNCLLKVRTPQTYSAKAVAASPDGRNVAVVSYGGYLSVFDLQRRVWIESVRPTTSGLSSVRFSLDGERIYTSSYDGQIYTHEMRRETLCAA